ncbi:probable hexosyltransferase MUCI70 [Ziziphus jujuba]|uniref:Probable hexosyltransferase MUCI70 n=1 Tax=Ziziphus jujuba TaxID=326968 RepID=A0A6P6GDA1_ZIZJJ|nr:probable hexosyltransferase MUCI70 [Ziziphus jujuba]
MTGASLGLRTGSYGSLQQQPQNGILHIYTTPTVMRKPTSREKEKVRSFFCRCFARRKVAMLLLFALALLLFVISSFILNKESTNVNITQHAHIIVPSNWWTPSNSENIPLVEDISKTNTDRGSGESEAGIHPKNLTADPKNAIPFVHPCANFAFPPPPPLNPKRIGPRPCPVCYLPVELAVASMPSLPSTSPVVHNLTYVVDENPIRTEPYGGSEFGGYPSVKQRTDSYDIKESMMVHCGFVKGSKPGYQTGFDIDEVDLMELQQFHDVIVASAIFGNYDIIQQPKNISELARKNVPFYMFVDEETHTYLKNSSYLESSNKVGLWRIIVVHNIPYTDSRRNGKIPKLLLHRIFPNIRYSIWIDGKLQLVVDPYQILERFLWRQNATFAISRHYKRYDVFEEAEANRAAGKYDNASIDRQIEFYRKEGLKPYSMAKLPITSDVPEGCVIIREHIPITNLFTCLWFNEVDRFTSRDQLSFSTVRDKIMERVGWSINMFFDCERRNFVIQGYHRDILEHMPPPVSRIRYIPPVLPSTNRYGKIFPGKKPSTRRGKERKYSSRRHRKSGIRDN